MKADQEQYVWSSSGPIIIVDWWPCFENCWSHHSTQNLQHGNPKGLYFMTENDVLGYFRSATNSVSTTGANVKFSPSKNCCSICHRLAIIWRGSFGIPNFGSLEECKEIRICNNRKPTEPQLTDISQYKLCNVNVNIIYNALIVNSVESEARYLSHYLPPFFHYFNEMVVCTTR